MDAMMMWMRLPGQSWPGAAASFVGMWTLMMGAMMLPSIAPILSRYRAAAARGGAARPGGFAALAGAGYLLAWAAAGAATFPIGAAIAAIEMQRPVMAHLAPVAAGAVVILAGSLQFTSWKARHLAFWHRAPAHDHVIAGGPLDAIRHGVRLAIRCGRCCANLMAIALVVGVMDVPTMAVVAAAITIERLAPAGLPAARANGLIAVAAGLAIVVRAGLA